MYKKKFTLIEGVKVNKKSEPDLYQSPKSIIQCTQYKIRTCCPLDVCSWSLVYLQCARKSKKKGTKAHFKKNATLQSQSKSHTFWDESKQDKGTSCDENWILLEQLSK